MRIDKNVHCSCKLLFYGDYSGVKCPAAVGCMFGLSVQLVLIGVTCVCILGRQHTWHLTIERHEAGQSTGGRCEQVH
eukprot:468854-Amphidinium_carterae.1